MSTARLATVCLLLSLAACSAAPSVDDAGLGDAGDADAGPADSGSGDSGWDAGAADAGPTWCRAEDDACFVLTDGGTLAGRALHRFDHRTWWWTPSQTTTWAVWPGDTVRRLGAVQFASVPGVERIERAPASVSPPAAFRGAMADAGFVLSRMPLDGTSFVITGHERYHLEEDGYGDFAWDLVRKPADGGRWTGAGLVNADYLVWDSPVYLPATGRVVEVLSDAPDNAPGGYDAGARNNLVGVYVGGSFSLFLLHFRQDTIPRADAGTCAPALPGVACVEVGAVLPAGTYLGRVGNSGVSAEPHLHLTLLAWDAPRARYFSTPSEFAGYYASGTGRDAGFVVRGDPATGDFVSPFPF